MTPLTPEILLRAYAFGVFPMAEGRNQREVYWVDPKERLIAILMLQAPNQRDYYRALVRDMVYAAVVK